MQGKHTHKLQKEDLLKIDETNFDISLRAGKINGWGLFQLVGNNTNIPTTEVTIANGMPINSINRITFPASSAIMTIASTDANDTAAGTGLRTILIGYLDDTFAEKLEVVTLNGLTKVATSSMFRIQFLVGLTAGSSNFNLGNIYIGLNSDTFSSGVPDTEIFHTMGAESNLSACGTFTTAHKAYVIRIDGSNDASINKIFTQRVYARNDGELFVLISSDYFTVGGLSAITTIGGSIVAKGTDVEITGQSSTGTAQATVFIAYFTEDTTITQP